MNAASANRSRNAASVVKRRLSGQSTTLMRSRKRLIPMRLEAWMAMKFHGSATIRDVENTKSIGVAAQNDIKQYVMVQTA
jgi:hypothetical protein